MARKKAAPKKPLSDRQQRFVEEYAKDRNATAAAERAGYKQPNMQGPRLMVNDGVRAAIDALLAVASEQALVDAAWVLARLRENVERAMQAIPVTDREGNETGQYTYEGAVANKGLELLGKHLGLFPNKHVLTGKDGGPIQHEHLTDEACLAGLLSLLDQTAAARPDSRPAPGGTG